MMLHILLLLLAAYGWDLQEPRLVKSGTYHSHDIHVDADGELHNLRTSGVLGEMNLELEYLIEEDFMAVTLRSYHHIIADGQFKFDTKGDSLVLDSGDIIRVSQYHQNGYTFRYKDHIVHVLPGAVK